MFAFCVGEFRFSEDAANSRITVARAARGLPAGIVEKALDLLIEQVKKEG